MTLFYENLNRICGERGTKISPVVQAIGLDKSTGTNWKRRQSPPEEEILMKLANHLDCKVSDFFKDETEREYHEELLAYERIRDQAEDRLDEFEQYLIDLYNKLDTKGKTTFMQLAYDFAEEKGIDL